MRTLLVSFLIPTLAFACVGNAKDTGDGLVEDPPKGDVPVILTAGMVYTCGIDKAGLASCWGLPMEPSEGTPASPYPDTVFMDIDADAGTTCGVRLDGTAVCWGGLFDGIELVDGATDLRQISMGRSHACGVHLDGSLTCFGGTGTVPAGDFTSVSVGDLRSCAVAVGGGLECWGEVGGFAENAPSTGVSEVDVSGLACAIQEGGVVCWDDTYADLGLLAGVEVVALQTGANFVCGITPEHTLVCDGETADGRSEPPAGTYTALGLGYDHGCASGPDGLVCWGADGNGQASP